MKIEKEFVSQKICDKTVLVRTNAQDGFCGIVELNDTAADIWNCFEKGYSIQEAAQELTKKYDVDYSSALDAVKDTSKKLIDAGILVEE